ncbi:hypothetical protein J3F83DRAFT_744912 [Trichoderma novae-zelandiae]
MPGCERTLDGCRNILMSVGPIMTGNLGVAYIDITDPDTITCSVRRNTHDRMSANGLERQENPQYNIRVVNARGRDGGREILTMFPGIGVEVREVCGVSRR